MGREEGGDGRVEKLGSVIGLEGDNRERKLGVGIGDEVEDSNGGVGFAAKRKGPHKMRVIIDNDEVVFETRITKNGRSPQIAVN